MAEFKPNDEQRDFIESFGKNLLVSASAGSGKTSTMIQKLIKISPVRFRAGDFF